MLRWITFGLVVLPSGCTATAPAGFGQPSIHDANGQRTGYISETGLGQKQVRDTRGVLLREIRE